MLIVGQLLDHQGFCRRTRAAAVNHPGRTFDARDVHSLEQVELRSVQPAVRVNLSHDHGREIGGRAPPGADRTGGLLGRR